MFLDNCLIPATVWELIYSQISFVDSVQARLALRQLNNFLLERRYLVRSKHLIHRYSSTVYQQYMSKYSIFTGGEFHLAIRKQLASAYPNKRALILLALDYEDIDTLTSIRHEINVHQFTEMISYAIKCAQISPNRFRSTLRSLAAIRESMEEVAAVPIIVGTVSERLLALKQFIRTDKLVGQWSTSEEILSATEFNDHLHKTALDLIAEAAFVGQQELIRRIIEVGVDVRHAKPHALCLAVELGRCDIVQLLLDHGFGTMNQENIIDIAMKSAVSEGCLEIVRLLFRNGANIHSNDDLALRVAIKSRKVDIVKYLIEHGAFMDSEMLFLAAQHGNCATMKLLTERGRFMNVHAKNDFAFKLAAQEGHLPMIQYLVLLGADIHLDEEYAFRVAASKGYFKVVEYCIQQGADIHAENDYAIRMAASEGHDRVVRLLLDHGANIHAENNFALRHAAKGGHYDIVELLLAHGADLHAEEDFAFRKACEQGHQDIALQLILKGAKIHAENDDAFKSTTNLDVLHMLLESRVDIHLDNDYKLRNATELAQWDLVKFLIQRGANIHVNDDYPLQSAASRGELAMVSYLLDKGADIHAADDIALQVASEYGYSEVVGLLLDRGANIHAVNDKALRAASRNGRLDVVRLLIERGANIHATNDDALCQANKHRKFLLEQCAKSTE
jgi:ankyrin repeat protein